MKRKFLLIIFVICISLSITGFADETDEFWGEKCIIDSELDSYIPDVSEHATLQEETIYEHLFAGMENLDTEINISSFKISRYDIDEFCNIYGNTLRTNPCLYYVSFKFRYSYNSKGILTKIIPQYTVTDTTEIEATKILINEKINEIASLTDSSMSDVEKLLTIYNTIALTSSYDHTFEKNTAKDLLLDGESVCEGYASAMYAIAEKVGIKGGFVRSEDMNHIWNAFYIDGVWYHADATWDDLFEKDSTRMTYVHFLKSDQWMTDEAEHYGFDKLNNDTEAKYDTYFWNEVETPVVLVLGDYFYIKNKLSDSGIYRFNSFTNESSQIYEFDEVWYTDSEGVYYWNENYSGLAYFDERLYFNTSAEIMSCNLDGTDTRVEYVLQDSSETSIYGCYGIKKQIYFAVGPRSHPSFDQVLHTWNICIPLSFQTSMQAFLNLEAIVTMSVGYKLEDMDSINPSEHLDRLGLLIWNADEAPEEAEATYENCSNIIEGAVYNSEKERFETTTDGIAAKKLGDALSFRVYYLNDDGSYSYSKYITNYSPKKYCYNQIINNPDDEKVVNLMVSILNYGAAAQAFFDYNTENLMNSELAEEQKTIVWNGALVRSDYSVPAKKVTTFVRNEELITSVGGFLALEGAIDYNFYAKPSFTPESATIYYWTESAVNRLDELTLQNATSSEQMTWDAEKGRYEAAYEGQPAKKMFNTIYACMVFETVDGEMVYSGVVGYSPERYAYINQDKGNANAYLARCLAVYGNAAREYFNNN